MNISLWFSKAQWALDHPKLRAPKIEPWSHPFHRSGPPSSSTPAPHTVSITWTLRITLWHKTRVCPFHDWVRSFTRICSWTCCSSMRFSGFRNVVVTGSLCSKSEGWLNVFRYLKGFWDSCDFYKGILVTRSNYKNICIVNGHAAPSIPVASYFCNRDEWVSSTEDWSNRNVYWNYIWS